MEQRAEVFYNKILAGILTKTADGFLFTYTNEYFNAPSLPPISLTISKGQQQHRSKVLFPFFYGLLSEGINKEVQCSMLKIDEDDFFTRLIRTAEDDTIGAITLKELR